MTVIFPEIEPLLITAVKGLFDDRTEPFAADVWISNAMPKTATGEPTRHDRMIIIRDDSGGQLDQVREVARVGVQFWGSTREEAADLAQLGRALLNGLSAAPIKRVRNIMRPVFIEDDQPLFYGTFELTVRGTRL